MAYMWDQVSPMMGNQMVQNAWGAFPSMMNGVQDALRLSALSQAFGGGNQPQPTAQPTQPNPYSRTQTGALGTQWADTPYQATGYHTQFGNVMPTSPGFVPNGQSLRDMNDARVSMAQSGNRSFFQQIPMFDRLYGSPGQGGYFGNILGNLFGGGSGGGIGGIKMTPIPVGFASNFGGSGGVVT